MGQNMLVDGSTVTLLPRAETGLIVSILFIHTVIIGSVPDPYVFGPPGSASGSASGSVYHKYGSGFGSGFFLFLIKFSRRLKRFLSTSDVCFENNSSTSEQV